MSHSPASTSTHSLLEDRDYTIILARTEIAPDGHPPGFRDLWEVAEASVLTLIQQCEALDPDGITLYVSCRDPEGDCQFIKYDQVTSQNLTAIIQENYPPQAVNLQVVMNAALDDYFARKTAGKTQPNGEMLLVLLDGEPHDRLAIARSIVKASQRLDRDEELGIGFVQIGQNPMAQGFFQVLDDNLKGAGAKFDIVHTKILETINPHSLLDFLLDVLHD